ncbi:MAG: hypothetical protein AAB323_01975 [Pseudomonadota bacterium]
MTHLVPVGNGLGVQIPHHLLKAAHLDDASDLFFEVTMQGLLIKPPSITTRPILNIAQEFEQLRRGVTLGPGMTLKQLIEDGRKW